MICNLGYRNKLQKVTEISYKKGYRNRKSEAEMPRGRKPRTWIKLDCNGILGGSINYLIPTSRQIIWVKMICFSEVCGGRPGYIEDNNERGLPHDYIAHQLNCSVEDFEDVLKIMTEDGAVKSNGTGSIHLVNFDNYQLTEYDRQKPYRQAKKQKDDPDNEQ